MKIKVLQVYVLRSKLDILSFHSNEHLFILTTCFGTVAAGLAVDELLTDTGAMAIGAGLKNE